MAWPAPSRSMRHSSFRFALPGSDGCIDICSLLCTRRGRDVTRDNMLWLISTFSIVARPVTIKPSLRERTTRSPGLNLDREHCSLELSETINSWNHSSSFTMFPGDTPVKESRRGVPSSGVNEICFCILWWINFNPFTAIPPFLEQTTSTSIHGVALLPCEALDSRSTSRIHLFNHSEWDFVIWSVLAAKICNPEVCSFPDSRDLCNVKQLSRWKHRSHQLLGDIFGRIPEANLLWTCGRCVLSIKFSAGYRNLFWSREASSSSRGCNAEAKRFRWCIRNAISRFVLSITVVFPSSFWSSFV